MGAWEDGFAAGWRAREVQARGLMPGDYDIPSNIPSISPPKPKRKGKKNPRLSRAMKKAYKKAHLKSGKFRKGWNRSRMLKYAHKIK